MNRLNKVRYIFMIGLFGFFMIPLVVYPSSDPLPWVSEESIKGVWESSSERSHRVFQLEILDNQGLLVFVVMQFDEPCVYYLEKTQFLGGGMFKMEFLDGTGSRIVVYGSGVATKKIGVLDIQLDMNPGGVPNMWKLKFIKMDGKQTYLEMLAELSNKASEGRKRAKEKERQSSLKKGKAGKPEGKGKGVE